uniref:CSON010114 protein n=1 Tax=Culicoides sonorensis TaxID=179676 RepID=A0A336LQ83_CULSO
MKIFCLFIFIFYYFNIGFHEVQSQAAVPVPFTNEQLACIRNCPRITNYNPICGSDGFLYENQGHLNCAQRCNHNVQAVRGGRCAPFLNSPNQSG